MDAFISYDGLPIKSGGAHSLGNKSIDKIYSEATAFIHTFTNSDNPKAINITFYTSQNRSYKTLPILWDLTKCLGIPSYNSWDLGTVKQRLFTWKLKISEIQKGFQILEKYMDLPDNPYGPVVLSMFWKFHFIDKGTKKVLPDQDKIPEIDFRQENSQLYLRLGQRSTVSVWFAFPFSSYDRYASDYINSLAEYLPFKLSKNHWRIWKLSKNGNWIPNKIEINTAT